MAPNSSNPGVSQIEIQRVDKSYEAGYLEDIQSQGYEHLGEPLQIEFNKSIDEIRNWVLAKAMNMDANLITEVENPAVAPGHYPIIVYYIWRSPQEPVPQAEPQAFACPYCNQPFMAVPGPQSQVVACPNCGGANIIPAMDLPPEQPAETTTHAPTPAQAQTETQARTHVPPEQLQELVEENTNISPSPTPSPTPAPKAAPAKAPVAQASTAPAAAKADTAAPVATSAPKAVNTPMVDPEYSNEAETEIQTEQPVDSYYESTEVIEENINYEEYTYDSESGQAQTDQYEYNQYQATRNYSTEMPSFDFFTKKVESETNKPKLPLLTPEYEQSYNTQFTSIEQAIKINMQKLAELLANPKNTVKFYDSGELMYPKITIRKNAYLHLGTREMDLLLIKDGVNDYKILANESHGAISSAMTPMQDELFALKTLGHASYRTMEDWAYLDNEQKLAVSKCIFAFTDIYVKKIPKEVEPPVKGRR